MADEHVQGTPSPSPPPCAKGCGFFGSPSTMNMCSKCFREHQRTKAQEQATSTSPDSSPPTAPVSVPNSSTDHTFSTPIIRPVGGSSTAAPSVSSPALDLSAPVQEKKLGSNSAARAQADPTAPPPRKVQKNTSRCFSCRKKIGLTGFKCRCGYFYCAEHRYSDKHNCDFDYQASARKQLEKANPVVVASKLDKI